MAKARSNRGWLAGLLLSAAALAGVCLWEPGGGTAAEAARAPDEPAASFEIVADELVAPDRIAEELVERTVVAAPASTAPRQVLSLKRRSPPPGFEVHVWRDGAPVAGVRVRTELLGVDADGVEFVQPEQFGTTDANGRCAFTVDGEVRGKAIVEPEHGAPIEVRLVEASAQAATPRYYVKLGSGHVFGTVLRPDGAPAAHVTVSVNSSMGLSSVQTDAAGEYQVTGLGEGLVFVRTMSEPLHETAGHAQRIELRRGESRRVDLGRLDGALAWTGRWLDVDGEPTHENTRFWAISDENGTQVRVDVVDGRFTTLLFPGAYRLSTDSSGLWGMIGRVTATHAAIEQDVRAQDLTVFVNGKRVWLGSGAEPPSSAWRRAAPSPLRR